MANFMWPGAFLCFAAGVFLIFISIGPPTWDKVFFMEARGIHFGPFGFTGSDASFGYEFPSSLAPNINTKNIHNLTKTLFLFPVAAGFAMFGAIAAGAMHRASAVFFTTLAFLTSLLEWVLSMVLFGIVRNRIREAQNTDDAAQYALAEWFGIVAVVLLGIAWWLVLFGAVISRRRHHY